jgi:2-methylcitrate dehydratase
MRAWDVRAQRVGERLPREEELAWRLAEVAADQVPVEPAVAEMAGNRLLDDLAVAIGALGRPPVTHALAAGLAAPRPSGATLVGLGSRVRVRAEWAAWANGTAVRELDFHDTFLAADFSHPGDTIPPLLALAQQAGRNGKELVRAVATAYEVQVDLTKAIDLHSHRIDHVAHLAPAVAAGAGALLGLAPRLIYQAINQAVHCSTATRQSRKGRISSWKASAPAHASKVALEAVDRAARGETAPAPIYEGEDGVLAWLLGGPEVCYSVVLPEPGEPKRAMLETYTKEYSAEYQAQAFIDLARRLRPRLSDLEDITHITLVTSDHTHTVIGTGSKDPEKLDPDASRETLDHSVMYLFAVALEDGTVHHEASYTPERRHRPSTLRLWRVIETVEDPTWTERYHDPDPAKRAFGGKAVVDLADGSQVVEELAVADAHPSGARPFGPEEYAAKFEALAGERCGPEECRRVIGLCRRLPSLDADDLVELNPAVHDAGALLWEALGSRGIL